MSSIHFRELHTAAGVHAEVADQVLLGLALGRAAARLPGGTMRMSPFFTSTLDVMCSGVIVSRWPTSPDTSTTTPSWISLSIGNDAMSGPPSAMCIGPSRWVPVCSEVSMRCDTTRFICSVWV
ncbi:MAG: hypothetical protein U5K29_15030 [Acidimicrobiales bacterium]|nr:hypothetical protein [Acidimicrobiales bacterium]